jgi:hypothetical protein
MMATMDMVIMTVFKAAEPTLDHSYPQSVFIHCMSLTVNSSYICLLQELAVMKMYCVFCEVGNEFLNII